MILIITSTAAKTTTPASTSKFRPTSACVGLGALLRPDVGPMYRKKFIILV